MKTLFSLIAISAVALLAGCASGQNKLALDTVGPAISSKPIISPSTNGTLLVYSAFRRNADFNSRDPYRQEYSDYEILTGDGKLLQRVHNNSGTIFQDAVAVTLAPGKYEVKARANGYGIVTIPILVAKQQTTILHLEGGFSPADSGFNATNAVRLPDGRIVGWKAASL